LKYLKKKGYKTDLKKKSYKTEPSGTHTADEESDATSSHISPCIPS
jgi:hypothetical protein